jgi:membrane protein YdbS with pleckstrin-like domain
MPMRPEPSERLHTDARTIWRLGGLITFTICAVLFLAGAGLLVWLDVIPWWWAALAAVLLAIPSLLGIYYVPELTWRTWRYEVGEDEVDLQSGVFTVTRTLIPMARIQHVDTRRGLLQRRFGLATVVLYTAAGSNEIPGLADPVAGEVRDRIAALANTHDDL